MKEKRVYVINVTEADDVEFNFREAEQIGDLDSIKSEAERQGGVYTLGYFADEINDENLFLTNSFILID